MDNKEITLSATGKEIELYEQDGIQHRRFIESGVIQYLSEDNKWLFSPGTAKNEYDSESGKEAAMTRWEEHQNAAMLGFIEATEQPTELAAVQEYTRVITKHGMDGKRGFVQPTRELVGLVEPKSAQQSADGLTLTLSGSLDAFRQQFGQQYRDTDTSGPELANTDQDA